MSHQVNEKTMQFFKELRKLCETHGVYIYGREDWPDNSAFDMGFINPEGANLDVYKVDINGGPNANPSKDSNWVIFGSVDNQSVKVEF